MHEADIEPFDEYYVELRRALENEFAHKARGSDVTLAEMFIVTAQLCTLTNPKPSRGV